jgi:hypothetical protein
MAHAMLVPQLSPTAISLQVEHDIVVIGEAEEGETRVALAFESNPILSPPPPRGPRKTCP